MNAPDAGIGSRALACTRCGGGLVAGDELEDLRCRYCGTDHLLVARDDVAAVAPAGRISARRAHRALLEALREQGIPGANVIERRLAWVPFWHVKAKLVGWQVYHVDRERTVAREGPHGEALSPRTVRENERVEELVARDLDVTSPACDGRGWGLLGVRDRLDDLRLRPFAPEREGRGSLVCSVVVPLSVARRRALQLRSQGLLPRGATAAKQRLSLVRVRQRLVYYPVWKFRYTIGGAHGEADVDGMRARVLRADVPVRRPSRGPRWLGEVALAGWVAGLHPLLGIFGLAAHLVRRAGEEGPGLELDRWPRWLSGEFAWRRVERIDLHE